MTTSTITPAPSKADKFKADGTTRVNAAIKSLRKVRDLANKNRFEYTDAQVSIINEALDRELSAIKSAFTSGNPEGVGLKL